MMTCFALIAATIAFAALAYTAPALANIGNATLGTARNAVTDSRDAASRLIQRQACPSTREICVRQIVR